MSVPTTGCESDSSVQFVEGNLIMTITVGTLTFSMDVKDLLTLVIASYGAVLSTIVFRSQQADKKQKLRVRRKEGMFTYGATIGEVQVIVEAANIGRVVVVVDGFGIGLPDGNHLVFPGLPQVTNLPVKISPGEKADFYVPKNVLLRELLAQGYHRSVQLVPRVTDQLGNTHVGESFLFDVAEATR